jgi:serine phosphatase RsbU (regulator of sigma subunit)
MFAGVALRKSTKIWLAVFGVGVAVIAIDHVGAGNRLGGAAIPFWLAAIAAGAVLVTKALAFTFRAIVRRLTLRLAFSYFLIGIVPIPLLACFLLVAAYVVANQVMGRQVFREAEAEAETATAADRGAIVVRIAKGVVTESGAPWLPKGAAAPWAEHLSEPRPVLVASRVWMAAARPDPAGLRVLFVPLDAGRLQAIADRSGYSVRLEGGTTGTRRTGVSVGRPSAKSSSVELDLPAREPGGTGWVRPAAAAAPGTGQLDVEWVTAVRLEPAVISVTPVIERPVAVFLSQTSPRKFARSLFRQGMKEVGGVLFGVLAVTAVLILSVYLVALVIAFVLVGSIARNVNRMTRAAAAIGRGDFSFRIHSRSRDQIGDLARSFDGMAASIQNLLVETAKKEKIDAELSVARTIQQSLLPESGGTWPGFRAVSHFEPVAEVGGDFYDILPMPDGRTAVVIGDVAGHGLPTGLVAAAAKASLVTFVEMGVNGPEICAQLARRSLRGRERRLYMTLALFAYDAGRHAGVLTNAGHPAPYRISAGRVERLPLPAFPIGLIEQKVYPSREFAFSPGDRVVFFTDGIPEAVDGGGEPFGYERLEALLEREASRTADELLEAILAAVSAHVKDAPLEDDRTLLLLTLD